MADEARAVLAHLLVTVQDQKSRHYEKYAGWLQGSPGIEEFLFGCLRPGVVRWIEGGRGAGIDSWVLKLLKATGGDIKGKGVYLHGILGLDRFTRKYIGQSTDLPLRIYKQHMYFRYRRDHPSLHYFAVQRSSFDVFSILAVVPPPPSNQTPSQAPNFHDRPDLLLNILEMWLCLLFRSLPVASLHAYLPPGSLVSMGPPESLNVALPLDQGVEMGEREMVDIKAARDPLLREWFKLDEGEVAVVGSAATARRAGGQRTERSEWGQREEVGGTEVSPVMMFIFLGAAVVLGFLMSNPGKR
ncbi:uncharacterized protein BDZ99DRAFT_499764 [Mytilinidion resinicola]|uniref:Uncharacterized protein n=1 Tax=Mytilinidion resinicola TaxID=574789 RepID=A0A6A6YIQ7_9PEZI|nr:uncharacterized protein BDZ99DRAFT_499764 [Mytilinidion resinicola]KAF2808449.1 hypothetical protein BDZ99DRAFT_499764 [Mytilinidion resinicola]